MSLSPETHRLTNITGAERHPYICQSCGGSCVARFGNGLMRKSLTRWIECDHLDRREMNVVVLCEKCSRDLIEQHPRLYHQLDPNMPFPGCMGICVDCKLRSGVSCSCPDAKANGGPGVELTLGQPIHGFIDYVGKNGRKTGHAFSSYDRPASACRQKVKV